MNRPANKALVVLAVFSAIVLVRPMAFPGSETYGQFGGLFRGLGGGWGNDGGGWNDGGGNRNYRNNNQNYNQNNNQNYNQNYYQQQPQYVEKPAPAAPAKYKPVAIGPYAIQDYRPNRLAPPPVFPPASVRNRLMKDLDSVILTQIDTVDEVLKSAGISDLAVRTLLANAQRSAGAGLDAELFRDLKRATAEKDAPKVYELGEAMSLPDEPLKLAVLATYVGQLRKNIEDAVDPSDIRATAEVQKTVRKFKMQLNRYDQVDKTFRDGLNERLDGIVAILDAREELHDSAAEAKELGSSKLEWPAGDVWVLASPDAKVGSVFYITSNLVFAGTKVAGPVSVTRSTVAAAVGCLTVEPSPTASPVTPALKNAKQVTFINPPSSGRTFEFQLNGHDYQLKPGTMLQFNNSEDKKMETFRYAGADGEKTKGFNFIDAQGKLVKEGFFVMNWNGSTWSVSAEQTPPFVSMASHGVTSRAMYIRNDSNRTVSFKFNNQEQTLGVGSGRYFDKVDSWVLSRRNPQGKEIKNTLAAGMSFHFANDDSGGVTLLASKPAKVTIDNSENAVPFTYALGDSWYTVEPYQVKDHSYPVPPQGLTVTYDQSNARLQNSPVAFDQTYTVAVTPTLQFTLTADRYAAIPTLEVQRAESLRRGDELVALAEKIAEQRLDRASQPVQNQPQPGGVDPAVVRNEPATVARIPASVPAVSKTRRPSAHLLSIGISKYSNSNFNLKYADRDADEFANAFCKAGEGFFQNVFKEVLINERATKLAIEKALDTLTKTVDDNDLVVMFFSAHGLSDDKRYYLCTHNVDPEELISTAVKYSDIVDAVHTLQGRDCRVVLLADTCNSGALGAGLGKKAISDKTLFDAHKDYSTSGSGCVLLASSIDGQASIERDEWQHGAFTKSLLDAMSDSSSDQDGDGLLYLDELVSAARRKLRKMTDNKQRLPINWPSEIQDFPLVKATP